jgi:hypothetical protein
MAEIGKTNAGDKSDITGTDHRDFHGTLQNVIVQAHRGPASHAHLAASIVKHTRLANAGCETRLLPIESEAFI